MLGLDGVVALAAAYKVVSNSDIANSCLNDTCVSNKETIHSTAEGQESTFELKYTTKDAEQPTDEILHPSEDTGRSTEEDLKYIFGETFVEPNMECNDNKESERRRSKRSNQGRHWKFGKKAKRQRPAARKPVESESEESIMSNLTSTLEAFDKEIREDKKRSSEELDDSLEENKQPKQDSKRPSNESCESEDGEFDSEGSRVIVMHSQNEQGLVSASSSGEQRCSGTGRRRGGNKEGEMVGMYHLRKCSTYLSPDEAKKVLPSYYSFEDGFVSCRICQISLTTDAAMEQHLLDSHLKLLLYKCELCSMKLRTKEDYNAHILDEHGASHIETMEVPGAETVDQVVSHMEEEEAGMEQSVTTIIINEEKADNQTVLYLAEAAVDEGDESMESKKRRGRVKTEEIYVAGADRPILGKTKVLFPVQSFHHLQLHGPCNTSNCRQNLTN